MKSFGSIRLSLACLLALPAATSSLHAADSTPLAQKPEVAAALQVLDAWIAWTARDREQPGLSIGIVRGEDLIWAKGYGFADLEKKVPATPATAYRIASISKLFTATALLHLRDAGKLQLDDPVAKHLPWFRLQDKHPESPTITVRHLITHTSGIPRELSATYWGELVRFESDAAGNVTRLVFPGYYLLRQRAS